MENTNQYSILAVDDAKDSLMLLEFDLADSGYQVFTAESGESALTMLEQTPVNLILLDMHMPGISGLETLQKIKTQTAFKHIPVIMLSASGDEEKIVAALELGADDYVTKPYISNVLLARMRNSLRLMEKTLQLEALAKTDFLTKLNNRGSFEELTNKAISLAKRTAQTVSFAMFDLDFFKQVNDNYGHEAGDKALIEFSTILKDAFRGYDIVGRIGGEEFAVCMPNTSTKDALLACERCRETLAQRVIDIEYEGKPHQLSLTVSIGITSAKGASIQLDEMLRLADHALYKAKENGRNQSMIEEFKDKSIDASIDSSVSDKHIAAQPEQPKNELANNEQKMQTEVRIDEEITQKPHCEKEGTHSMNEQNTNEKFPGIDFTLGVNNVLGDEALFSEILVMFYQDHCQDDENIQNAIDNADQAQVKHLVHTLKGVACSIGAMELFDYCKTLDVAVNEEKVEQYQSLFEPAKQELIMIKAGIEHALADKLS